MSEQTDAVKETKETKGKTARSGKGVPSFEAGLARLDEIIRLLEGESLPLDDMMKYYEEGVALLRRCNQQLDSAEQKVKLLRLSPDGKTAYLEAFTPGENEKKEEEKHE